MSELFNEVDEDLRRDQLKKLWDRYSLLIIAGAILIIASVGGWRGYQYFEAKKAAEAGSAFNAAADLAEQNKHAEAEAAFAKLMATAPSGYRTLARLRLAAEIAARDAAAGAKAFDEIAADARCLRSIAKWRNCARPRCCSRHAAIPTWCSGWNRRPRPPAPFATPRANCCRCRRGARRRRRRSEMA